MKRKLQVLSKRSSCKELHFWGEQKCCSAKKVFYNYVRHPGKYARNSAIYSKVADCWTATLY